ncbi:MAG: Xaa-Pro dipeptidase [Methanosaeta sp. PtaU1.Bin112]|nr:MAG: Xaa-Pro dipeptidase [Methanosaeta sp. PtaU1.Bin112]
MPSPIQTFLDRHNLDGFLFVGDSICDADIFYLSHFLAGDRFAFLAQEKSTLLVSSMEIGRADKESIADRILSTSQYRIKEKLKICENSEEAYGRVLTDLLRDCGIKHLGVPYRFPAGLYQHLIKDFAVTVMESPASLARVAKTQEELLAIEKAQRACERAMAQAICLIDSCKIQRDWLYSDSQPLTSEKVRSAIEISLLEDGCESLDTIVAGGPQAADPHARGNGPLAANSPIVIDIFPRNKSSRYFADMTRTVLKGEAPLDVQEIYEAVCLAQAEGLRAIRAGVSGKEVHSRVSEVFRDQGFPETEGRGFTHSTGHGVGLDVHEKPSLSDAGEILPENCVVTVEPGLYYPDIGGVRMEDMVVVKKDGCKNLTLFEKKLVI